MAEDPYKYFRVEARDLLEHMGLEILELERGPAPESLARLLRHAHTLKGAARVVKQPEIGDLCHTVEDALAPLGQSDTGVSHDRIDLLLGLLDEINRRVAVLHLPVLDKAPSRSDAAEGTALLLHPKRVDVDSLLEGMAETRIQLEALRKGLSTADRARQLAHLLTEELEPRLGNRPIEYRLAVELRTLLGGMARQMTRTVDQLDRELHQVSDSVERQRLVPAGALFMPLSRSARDAAQELGKQAELEGRGGEVRLEAQVLSVVQPALVQMVRNAVAHGIESESGRLQAGKHPTGKVTVTVARRGRRVSFRCQDDGKGIDLAAVRRAARRKGLLSPNGGEPGLEVLTPILLGGGISTSAKITGLSGRGVGMDVVREAAAQLKGEVLVSSQPGKGTTVELVVPFSVAAIETLLAEVGGATVTIPLDAVRRTARLAAEAVTRTSKGMAIVENGQLIPFVPLVSALNFPDAPRRGLRPWSVVIIDTVAGTAALGVDRILCTANVILRPLPDLAPAGPLVAGAWLDVEGNPQLVLDPDGLVAAARLFAAPETAVEMVPDPILVIDDSLTTRMMEQSILESAGFAVDLATSAEEGLQTARLKKYSLFLVDVEMPGMDGIRFIQTTRGDPVLREIPTILVTSRDSPEDRRRGSEAGAKGYITKDAFDQTDFLEQVRRLVH